MFLLVNATLFIRPAEISPGLGGLPIYEILILLALLTSLPAVFPQLAWSSLKRRPVTLCVLGLLPAIVLSRLRHGNRYWARIGAIDFSKILIYFFLLVGLVDSMRRLRTFLKTITLLVLLMAAICVLNFHGVIEVTALRVLHQQQLEAAEGGEGFILRLQSLGIFSDPNDFSLILVTAMMVLVQLLLDRTRSALRFGYVLPLALLGYAFALTRSRGGFISLSAALAVFAMARWGWKRSLPILLLALPLLLLAFGGRQTDISLERGDTGMGRVLIWRDALVAWHRSPLFGIGYNQLADEIGIVAHNSFVHCFAELGLVGGTMWVGCFFFLIYGMHKLRAASCESRADGGDWKAESTTHISQLAAWLPCLLAITCGYAAGLCTLSRPYVGSTYVVLGAAAAFVALAGRAGVPIVPHRPVRKVVLTSLIVIVGLEAFVRVVAH